MKKTYSVPTSILLNVEMEQLIATSGLDIHPGEADQWTRQQKGWNSEDWTEVEE